MDYEYLKLIQELKDILDKLCKDESYREGFKAGQWYTTKQV